MKTKRPDSWLERKVHRSWLGTEFYNYPSPLAQKFWYYVLVIGRARCPVGFQQASIPRQGFLLHYIHRGQFWHRWRGRIHLARQGQACLVDFSDPLESGTEGSATVENWWVHFNSKDMPHFFTELRADRAPVFDSLDRKRFEFYFRELMALTKSHPTAYEARASTALSGMLAELFASRAYHGDLVNLVGRKTVLSEPVRKGIDYMVRFYGDQRLGLKIVCHAGGLSMHHFGRVFRAEVGMTPIQYLNRYRIEQAKRLLIHSEKSMEDISRLVGTSNQNYFAYLFRKQVGMAPREFRSEAIRRKVQ